MKPIIKKSILTIFALYNTNDSLLEALSDMEIIKFKMRKIIRNLMHVRVYGCVYVRTCTYVLYIYRSR